MSVLAELRRRHVFKVAVAYAIVAWLVVQIASVVAPALALPEWAVSFVVLLLILGFPIALFLAWAYELTPDGMRRTGEIALPERVRRMTGRRLDFTIIGALVVALGFVALDQYVLEERGRRAPVAPAVVGAGPSVAVLPFVSMSDEAEQEYFSDGISEELLNVLAQIPDLRVPSRTSSFLYKGTSTPLPTIAEELGVGHVLEGSVRKDGSQVRITAQLIDAATNSHVWSDTFTRELTSIFEIQDEIAAHVADVLALELLGDAPSDRGASRTSNAAAHDAYLQGLAYRSTLASADNVRARESFERAIELDPGYAAAYAMLASTYNIARTFEFMQRDETIAAASAAIERAIELDPELARAYFERGTLAQARGDLPAAIEDLERAADLGLNEGDLHVARATTLARLGRHREARAALERAVSLDPRGVTPNWLMGSLRLNRGDHAGARGYFSRAIEVAPTSPTAYAGMGDVETFEGRIDEAVRWYVAGLEQDPGQGHMTTWVGLLHLTLGDEARAQRWFDRAAGLLQAGTTGDFVREYIPLALRREDPARLVELVRGAGLNSMGAFGTRLFRKPVLETEDTAAIRAYYEGFWPGLFVEDAVVDTYNFEIVPDVAWILRSEGRAQRAEALLTAALDVFREHEWPRMVPMDPVVFVVEVELLTLLGREDEALEVLRREIDEGWRFTPWQIERDPVLASIRERPEFVAMLDEVRQDLAAQLAAMPAYEAPTGP